VTVNDGETLRALKACAAEPTGFLFGYRGEDGPHIVDSNEVNDYLREISSSEVTAKDMRTWLASARAAAELYSQRDIAEHGKRKSALVEVVKTVAQQLGNTPTVCRNSYLHPRLLAAFEAGEFLRLFANFRCRKLKWLRREDQILRHALARL
jgi:DNA topoisomerase-1